MRNRYFAQFYQRDLAGNLSPVLGSLGFMYLDGRHSSRRMDDEAIAEARKRGHVAAQVCYGTFTRVIRSGWKHVLDAEREEVTMPATKRELTRRRNLARRALCAVYEDWPDDKRQAITDALTDLRHLCDALRLNWADVLADAEGNYTRECGLSPWGLAHFAAMVARLDTESDMDDREECMSGDDACETVSSLIESARELIK